MSFGDELGGLFGDYLVSWSNHEKAIRAWIVSATGLPESKVIRAEQNGPKPAAPFIDIRLGGLTPVGIVDAVENYYDNEAANGEEIVQMIRGSRELEVSIRAFTESAVGDDTARALLSVAQLALRLDSIRDALAEAGLSPFDNGRIAAIPVVLETRWQGRAQLVCRFYLEETLSERTGYIASVELTNEVVDPPEIFTVAVGGE
jgi:hypothetical protein